MNWVEGIRAVSQYFYRKAEFVRTGGAAAANRPILLNENGLLDSSFVNGNVPLIDGDTYVPVITGSTSNPTVSYTTQTGQWMRIRLAGVGAITVMRCLVVINTISGGSGNLQISVPHNANGNTQGLPLLLRGVDVNGTSTAIGVMLRIQTSGQIGIVASIHDNADRVVEPVSALANGDTIDFAGAYLSA